MTPETINQLMGIGILLFMTAVVWESTKMIQEKKERQRKGLTDYYDNPINKLTRRAVWEEKHHKQFDYKEKNKRCIECGENDGRHTYTCIYYDTDK